MKDGIGLDLRSVSFITFLSSRSMTKLYLEELIKEFDSSQETIWYVEAQSKTDALKNIKAKTAISQGHVLILTSYFPTNLNSFEGYHIKNINTYAPAITYTNPCMRLTEPTLDLHFSRIREKILREAIPAHITCISFFYHKTEILLPKAQEILNEFGLNKVIVTQPIGFNNLRETSSFLVTLPLYTDLGLSVINSHTGCAFKRNPFDKNYTVRIQKSDRYGSGQATLK